MKILIRQATIISPLHPHNGKTLDILLENGIIKTIAEAIDEAADTVIVQPGLCVSPGWMDMFADFADPGYEQKETIETGVIAAATGGFTDVLLIPNSSPVVDNKAQVEYIVQKSSGTPVTVYPMGAVSKQAAGKELAEMYDMRQSGALAFGDGIHPIQNSGLLLKALQYVKSFNGTVVQLPDDTSIGPNGLMNEGIISTRMGLPGKPAVAEELMVARDIKLARYAGSKLHFTGVSSPKSLEYIRRAKEGGIAVTCSVTPYQVFFCDEDLQQYDSNLKLNPPLRTRQDMLAVRKALLDGTIDCIASHHRPQHWDNKTCEFEYAKPGMISLETMFGAVRSIGLDAAAFVTMQSVNLRRIFGLPVPGLQPGEKACLTLFVPDGDFVYTEDMIRSRSKNSPFVGKTLTGTVLGIINNGRFHRNN